MVTGMVCKRSLYVYTVKPVLSGHSKRKPKIGFQDRLLLNTGQPSFDLH